MYVDLGTLRYSTTRRDRDFIWLGCIFSNVVMAPTMLDRLEIWKADCFNLKKVKEQNIHRGDYRSNWFIRKNMKEFLMLILREKQVQNWSRAKREALINGNEETLPKLAKKDFNKKTPLVE